MQRPSWRNRNVPGTKAKLLNRLQPKLLCSALWYFMCGRGTREKVYDEFKNGSAFDSVPSRSYGANYAWQVLCMLAFNLIRGFQMATSAPKRTTNRKPRMLLVFECVQTLRDTLF